MTRIAALICLVWFSLATAASACPDPVRDGRTGWDGAHPLLGKVYDGVSVSSGPIVAETGKCGAHVESLLLRVRTTLRNNGVVILGEIHDNAEHHWWRGAIMDAVWPTLPAGPMPAAVFEHMRADQADAIRALLPIDDIFDKLQWSQSGWPGADLFRPLMRAAQNGWAITPGDPARGMVGTVARGGLAALPESEQRSLVGFDLDKPLAQPLQDALLTELEASHCGLVPRTAFGGMALAQRYRDAHLARAVDGARVAHGRAVLLTGNGHVRSDRGVPLYLRALAPTRPITPVMLIEVVDGKTDPADYVTKTPNGTLPADLIVFTPATQREDPCIAMRARMGRKQ